MNRLVLIDGNAVMHRAYHALPPLTAPDGKPVNIVYGFVSVVLKLYQDLKPTHMAVAFDRPGPTFRNKLYEAYQQQRPQMEDDFISQIAVVHDTVRALGIPIYEADGFEADDVIGTICEHVNRKKIDQVVIMTGDRDILQLVRDDNVLVYMPTKGLSEGKLYGETDVVARMGIKPSLIPDFKALAGDPSDNYPGVAGVGPKTAISLIHQYGSVDGIYTALEHHKGTFKSSVETKLRDGKESATLSHTLATIRSDAPIAIDESAMHIDTLDTKEARKQLERLRFPSLIKRLSVRSAGNTEVKKDESKSAETKRTAPEDAQQQLF